GRDRSPAHARRRALRRAVGRRRRGPPAAPPLRRSRLRQGRPPPHSAPGPARGGLRPREVARAVCRHRGRAAGRGGRRAGPAHPGERRAGRGGAGAQPGRGPHGLDARLAQSPAPPGTGGGPDRGHGGPARGPRVRGHSHGPRPYPRARRRRGRGGRPPPAGHGRRARRGRRHRGDRRHGGGAGQPGRRHHARSGDRRPDQHWVRRRARRGHRPAVHALLVCRGPHGRGHRQRLRRRLRGAPHPPGPM
ncbi:MAG: Circadian phase modifier, partial [uncultured Acidimicrobiales bacterium]